MKRIAPAVLLAKTIGLSKVNGRKPCRLIDAARHNLREIQAELGAVGRIDPALGQRNQVLIGPPTADAVQALAHQLLAVVPSVGTLRRDHVQALEFVFSAPPDMAAPDAFLAQCVAWLCKALPLPVLSAVIHNDEAQAHAHVLMLPIADGRLVGGSPIQREPLKRLMDRFFNEVTGPAGLPRMGAKLRGDVKRRAVDLVLTACRERDMHQACGPMWQFLTERIATDPLAPLIALGYSVNDLAAKPIGIAAPSPTPSPALPQAVESPIGIEQSAPKDPIPILCRDRPAALPQSPPKGTQQARLATAQAVAVAATKPRPFKPLQSHIVTRADGLTVERGDPLPADW